MNKKWMVLVAVLSLSACQSNPPHAVVVAPAPEVIVLSPASVAVPVVEPAPVVVVEAPAADTPVAVAQAAPVVAPVAVKPVAIAQPAMVAKPVVVAKPVLAAAPAAVNTVDALAIAKKRNCLACHQVDKKVVGPAWKDVAAKYRGDAGAQARLEAKIAKGGSGAWGSMPMPPQPQVTAEERVQLARFILNLK